MIVVDFKSMKSLLPSDNVNLTIIIIIYYYYYYYYYYVLIKKIIDFDYAFRQI